MDMIEIQLIALDGFNKRWISLFVRSQEEIPSSLQRGQVLFNFSISGNRFSKCRSGLCLSHQVLFQKSKIMSTTRESGKNWFQLSLLHVAVLAPIISFPGIRFKN